MTQADRGIGGTAVRDQLTSRIAARLAAFDESFRATLQAATTAPSSPFPPISRDVSAYLKVSARCLADVVDLPTERQREAIRAALIAMPASACAELPVDLVADHEALLAAELREAGVVDVHGLPRLPGVRYPVAIWQGDMSRLACGAVVNPANSNLLGCFLPGHRCLDNVLHAQAGPRLRVACAEEKQRRSIDQTPNGQCLVTPSFAMPSRYCYHTVGPDLCGARRSHRDAPREPTPVDERELASCYASCLDQAVRDEVDSIAFCCISTGIFGYPASDACRLACATVKGWMDARLAASASVPLVVFNVFKDTDLALYTEAAPRIFSE